jgi:hypothetical protein
MLHTTPVQQQLTIPVPAVHTPRRRTRHDCLSYVHFLPLCNLFQSRFHMGRRSVLGHVHLGLYLTEEAAHQAGVAFRRMGPSELKLPQQIAELVRRGIAPSTLQPKWTFALPGGGFGARRRSPSGVIEIPARFETPADAYFAILSLLTRGFILLPLSPAGY